MTEVSLLSSLKNMTQDVANLEKLQKKTTLLEKEIDNLKNAQGNLYRFQEKVERQKTIYAQIAEAGHEFNESLDFQKIVDASVRFMVDHLNFERCLIYVRSKNEPNTLVPQGIAGYKNQKELEHYQNQSCQRSLLEKLLEKSNRVLIESKNPDPKFQELVSFLKTESLWIYSLGWDSQLGLNGALIFGTSQEHEKFHLVPSPDEELHAVFLNITNQIISAQKTLSFLDAIQVESNQVKQLLNNMRQAVFSVAASGEIIKPVSAFSKQVFEDSIVGKNIFEVLFKDLDPGSELAGQLSSVFTTVFGEPEFQWDLVSHLLPPKLHIELGSQTKTLKLNCAPLTNSDELVEKIMFVIEDVTEIERLENRFSQEQKRLKIIQEIAASDLSSINRNFFDRTKFLLDACKQLHSRMFEDVQLFGDVMRRLHTIKGNARIYGYSEVSSGVHRVEGAILKVKEDLEAKAFALDKAHQMATEQLGEVDKVLGLYGEVVANVFRIPNDFYKAPQENDEEVQRDQFVEILTDNLRELKDLFYQEDGPKLEEIKVRIDRLHDVPVASALNKYSRMVHELSATLNKKVHLRVQAGDLKVNRFLLDHIQDALVHVIRNSLDHGLESTEDRIALGKSEFGHIHLIAQRNGAFFVLQISDDGRGINPDRVGEIAVQKKILTAEQVKNMTPAERLNIIFLPGFSAKEQASEISGRGIGLDMVQKTAAQMKGKLEVFSEIGLGTTFTLTLPVYSEFDIEVASN
ncbi:MAG: ATP-binding protein [Bdellovibrio sp.]